MQLAELDILIVPGLGDSGAEHWQTHWQARLPNARRVVQSDWEAPQREAWVASLRAEVCAATKPVLVVAHSLGVATTLLARPGELCHVAGALLVSPPDLTQRSLPENLQQFGPYPTAVLPFPSIVVASQDDPYAAYPVMAQLASQWGSRLVDAGRSGHINAASGHGAWPEGAVLLNELIAKAQA